MSIVVWWYISAAKVLVSKRKDNSIMIVSVLWIQTVKQQHIFITMLGAAAYRHEDSMIRGFVIIII